MDPTVSIDLSSIAGIVAATITLIHLLKGRIGQVPFLRALPLFLYVVAVSAGLTWVAHDVLQVLDGDRTSLIAQAIIQALAAAGVVEVYRAGTKSSSDTTSADNVRRGLGVLLVCSLGLSACVSSGKLLVEADRGIHATLTALDDRINRICDAAMAPGNPAGSVVVVVPSLPKACGSFNAALADGYAAYQRFNKAAQEGSIAGVPAMVTALADIRAAALTLKPEGDALLDDLRRWHDQLKALLKTKE